MNDGELVVTESMTITTFQEAEAQLAQSLPGYESRVPQQTLARCVEQALGEGTHLLAEAGTGTGKSLGYMIPAILSGQRVVISTATKALQDQLANKDLPFLQEHLGVNFTFAILKGRSNYLCRVKALEAKVPGLSAILDQIEYDATPQDALNVFLNSDFFAERVDFPQVSDMDWRQLTASSDECPGKKECPFGVECFSEKAKTRAAEAQVVVVNHAMFLMDLVVRQTSDGAANLLGNYSAVIFDEAHEIIDYASSAFGVEFSENRISTLVTEIDNLAQKSGGDIQSFTTPLLAASSDFFGSLEEGRLSVDDLLARGEEFANLSATLTSLVNEFAGDNYDSLMKSADSKTKGRRRMLVKRARKVLGDFNAIVTDENLVRWVERKQGKRTSWLVLCTAPIDVAPILNDLLFSQTTSILVSATMATSGAGDKFAFMAKQLGVEDYLSIDVGTPFDYPKQALLYIPEIPEPAGKTRGQWESLVKVEMLDLVNASKGRALLLFTSVKAMKDAHAAIARRIPYTVLMQGTEPNPTLAKKFMEDTHSVLFATKSFFTGVDFQGEACSLVVIDKLPFPVPDEPLYAARCEKMDRESGSSASFMGYTVPSMILVLKQGFGRLIRTRSDRGVVAIMDSRLHSKGYGRSIRSALPDAKQTRSMSDVAAFLETAAV